MADQIRDIVGGNVYVGGTSEAVDAIIAAKLKAKAEEAAREAEEDAQNNGGGVNFGPGCVITVGGKIYQQDKK